VRIGVLALQGDVAEHLTILRRCGGEVLEVRTASELDRVDGLIVPGGESPTIGKLLTRSGLDRAIQHRARAGMPVYGTCAGMILLAQEASGGAPPLLKLMDITVARNAYGRQRESFEAMLQAPAIDCRPFSVAFIRAPVVTRVGSGVQVLASHEGDPVLLQQGSLLASSFHPEIPGYDGVHRYFCDLVEHSLVAAQQPGV
jgi:5'-phosphate synthase pdxT subunit